MKKSYFGLIAILLLFTTYSPKFNSNTISILNIKKILIENNSIIRQEKIKKKLSYLYNKNLFFLEKKDIEKNLINEAFLDSFIIKKIYPNTLKLIIEEKIPVAILHHKKEKFYISNKGSLINFIEIKKYENLPTVFGKSENFISFYQDLENLNFPVMSIKSFYYFESGRWDLLMQSDKVIKLPEKNYLSSLENFMLFKSNIEFDKYKLFDYRIQNQLILN